MADDTIQITLSEYESLVQDSKMLGALEECGVDNWEGYGEARRLLREREDAEPVGPTT